MGLNLRRNLPEVQNVISGICLFFAVGIYTAVLNLGAGGAQADSAHVNNIVAASLYSIFGVVAFFAGSILNKLGPRYTMMIGAFGYPFYITGLWYFDKKGSSGYAITGGCVLGVGAAMLWTVSNYVAFAYGAEHQKAGFYATQAVLNTCGNFIAACVVFGITHNNSLPDGVPESVYASFFCLMLMAIVAGWFLCKPQEIRRKDGQPLAVFKNESYWQEIKGCASLLKDVKTWLLLPALLCAENPLVLQPTISAYWFDLRTRSLITLITAVIQLLAFIGFQAILDLEKLSRRARAYAGFAILFTILVAAYTGETGWFFSHPSGFLTVANGVDWTESGFGGFFVLFSSFRSLRPSAQCIFAGSSRLSPMNQGGSATMQVSCVLEWHVVRLPSLEWRRVAYLWSMKQVIAHFVCQVCSLFPVFYLVAKYVTATNYLEEKDVVFIPTHEAEVLRLQAEDGVSIADTSSPVEEKALPKGAS
ncbi:hypothetical protein LTR10_022502 [Elasticomyces elasticus]|nr:hypothetical protein LTR10_022502 [Elasticomyces elasticus]KAK5029451.1 hypothetical protein LTS07_005913 [Exophiala sideris]KAK5036851.1 hypothetical protein LTR13_005231 [Exophiala sideris]KAK5182040.1 hypothetical protein LTR44_005641 [Eurotiomycetes sp. CCFEE 6388]